MNFLIHTILFQIWLIIFFLAAQLAEIRKATAARMMCDIGDSVTEIQPEAFKMISNE